MAEIDGSMHIRCNCGAVFALREGKAQTCHKCSLTFEWVGERVKVVNPKAKTYQFTAVYVPKEAVTDAPR